MLGVRSRPEPAAPALPDGYDLVRELRRDRLGRVVVARRSSDNATFAIRLVSPRVAAVPGVMDAARSAVTAVAEESDPAVAEVTDLASLSDGSAALIGELIDGVTAEALFAAGPLPELAGMVLWRDILGGLEWLHRHGVLHRSVSSASVVVTPDGRGVLVDWAVAAPLYQNVNHSVGVPDFAAPELWQEGKATPATDMYAAAVLEVQALTGALPFRSGRIAAVRAAHLRSVPSLGRLSDGIRPLVESCLQRQPDKRVTRAADLIARLENVAMRQYGPDWVRSGRRLLAARVTAASHHLPSVLASGMAAGADSELPPPARRRSRTSVPLALVFAVLALLLAAAAVLIWHQSSTPTRTRAAAASASALPSH